MNLLFLFVCLAFFRASPEHLPATRPTLLVAIGVMLLSNTVVTYSWYGLGGALALGVLELCCSSAFLYVCLMLKEREERFQQSLAALCGAGAVMAVVAWPWALALGSNPDNPPVWVMWGQVVLVLWSLLVWARILRLAGGYPSFVATALSMGYFVLSTVLLGLFVS